MIHEIKEVATETTTAELRNILTMLGFALTIVIYSVERSFKYKADRTKSKKDWFLNIVLSPQLDTLNKFYDDVCNNLEKSIDTLVENKNKGGSKILMLIDKRIEIAKFKTLRKKHFNSFSSSIRSFDGNLANKFDEKINELDDVYSKAIESEELEKNRLHLITPIIYQNKSDAYRVLFSVIDSKTYKKLIKNNQKF